MSQSDLTIRYAKSLMIVARENKQEQVVLGELNAIKGALLDTGILAFFASPVVSNESKLEVLIQSLGVQPISQTTKNLLSLLVKNGRIASFAGIVDSFQAIMDSELGVTRGTVRALKPLDPGVQKNLESFIEKTTKQKIILTFKEDRSILGGVVADVGGWTFDDSVETHLSRMNEELMNN